MTKKAPQTSDTRVGRVSMETSVYQDDKCSQKRVSEDSYICAYCFHVYNSRGNKRGSCLEAPDPSETVIDAVSCMCCLKLVWYFRTVDDDGDYQHPWLELRHSPNWRQRLKWFLLATLMPCLCCYGPLLRLNQSARRLSLCGGRHEPMTADGRPLQQPSSTSV